MCSQVVVVQAGARGGQLIPMNTETGKNVSLVLQRDHLLLKGGGLNTAYELSEVQRVEVTPNGSRFGFAAPGAIGGFLVKEPGIHMVRIDARTFGKPSRSDLKRFGRAVESAVKAATGPKPTSPASPVSKAQPGRSPVSDMASAVMAGQLAMEVAEATIIREAESGNGMWLPRIDSSFVRMIGGCYSEYGASNAAVDALLVRVGEEAQRDGLAVALSWVTALQGVFALKFIAVGDGAITDDDNRLLEHFRLRQGEAQRGGV